LERIDAYTRLITDLLADETWDSALHSFIRTRGLLGLAKKDGESWNQMDGWATETFADAECVEATYRLFGPSTLDVSSDATFLVAIDQLAHQLRREAIRDSLTHALNRRGLYEWFNRRSREYSDDAPFVLVFFDIDRFKAFNDANGHATGDKILHDVASGFLSQIGRSDVLARVGGDEFVLILEMRDQLLVNEWERMCRSIVTEPFDVRFTAGTALYPSEGQTLDQLMAIADGRMYETKRSLGGNSFGREAR